MDELYNLRLTYGKARMIGAHGLRLMAPRDTRDGIGCALVFVPWDGRALRLEVVRNEVWRPEPWADFWFTPRESAAGCPHPMRYGRFTEAVAGFGHIPSGVASDQKIDETMRRHSAAGNGRQFGYRVSWSEGALHVEPTGWGTTFSLVAPVCELPLYCEACELTIDFEA